MAKATKALRIKLTATLAKGAKVPVVGVDSIQFDDPRTAQWLFSRMKVEVALAAGVVHPYLYACTPDVYKPNVGVSVLSGQTIEEAVFAYKVTPYGNPIEFDFDPAEFGLTGVSPPAAGPDEVGDEVEEAEAPAAPKASRKKAAPKPAPAPVAAAEEEEEEPAAEAEEAAAEEAEDGGEEAASPTSAELLDILLEADAATLLEYAESLQVDPAEMEDDVLRSALVEAAREAGYINQDDYDAVMSEAEEPAPAPTKSPPKKAAVARK